MPLPSPQFVSVTRFRRIRQIRQICWPHCRLGEFGMGTTDDMGTTDADATVVGAADPGAADPMDRRGFSRRMMLGGAAVATVATSLSVVAAKGATTAHGAESAGAAVRTAPAGGEVRRIKLYI